MNDISNMVKFTNSNQIPIIHDVDITNNLNQFVSKLNKEPNEENIKKHQAKYLPISYLEMQLDELFFGLWNIKNFQYSVIANEIVGSLELEFFHPIAKVWITRVGAGASMIRQKAESDITDLSAKIKNTLTMDFPKLKAECFKNACLSIGKFFGRDLNRKFETEFEYYWDGVEKISKLQYKEIHNIIKTKKIGIDIIESILSEYGIDKGENIPKELFNIIKERFENGK